MTPRKLYNFYIDPELADGLKALKERTGAPEAESIRRALSEYLKKHGAMPKTVRPRATTRKRS
jgi:predicted DNA-binding protein